MLPWLPEICLFEDTVPHSAAMNMAIDEALLQVIPSPILRVFRWAHPAVSFGYFERWTPIRAAHPQRDPVRRWTGGGVVLHGEDLTYSILIPGSPGAPVCPAERSYAIIHHALCRALNEAGIPAAPASSTGAKISQACFENPVLHDVLVDGRKIAGAAQRRTRLGLIHQGSVQFHGAHPAVPAAFATHLAAVVRQESFDVTAAAAALVAEKYGTRAWLEKRL